MNLPRSHSAEGDPRLCRFAFLEQELRKWLSSCGNRLPSAAVPSLGMTMTGEHPLNGGTYGQLQRQVLYS